MFDLTKPQLQAALVRMTKRAASETERADRAELLLAGLARCARVAMESHGMDVNVASLADLIDTLCLRVIAAEERVAAFTSNLGGASIVIPEHLRMELWR